MLAFEEIKMLKILSYVYIVCFSLIFSSCTSSNLKSRTDLKIFKYNENTGISSTDPALAKTQSNMWCVNHLYNGLVQLNSQLEINASIAKYWTISEDGKTYTFYLRNDVYFIDDPCFQSKRRQLTAVDVVYSFNRIIDPKLASPGAWIFRNKVIDYEPFKAISDSVFQLKLSSPFPPMLNILSMQYAFIVAKEAVDFYGRQFSYHPVGTGPFKLKTWEEGSAMYLVKNQNYFEFDGTQRLPYIDGIKISFIGNKKSEFSEFTKGNLSFVSDVETSYIDQVLDDNGSLVELFKGKIQLSKCPYLKTEYIGFNLQDSSANNLLRIKNIRLALNYCIDRNKIIRYFRNNIGHCAQAGMIPIGLPSYDTTTVQGYYYDPEKAKKLLREAGYYALINPQTIVLYSNPNYQEVALYISNEAAKVGLKLKVEIVEPNILREWMTQGKARCFRASWIADYPEAESFLCLFYSRNAAPPNYTRFSNAGYDLLYEQALVQSNRKKRDEIYQQMENIIWREAPVIPLYYEEVLRFTQTNITGIEPNALNLLDLKRVKINSN